MTIEPVPTPETKQETEAANKPLLNIKLPAPLNHDPNAPLSFGQHNAAAQNNFEEIARVLTTIINNQKMLGMAIQPIIEKQKELDGTLALVLGNIKKLLEEKENKSDEPTKPGPTTTA